MSGHRSPFQSSSTHPRPYSSFRVKGQLFRLALGHSLHDATHATVPVAIIGGAVAFLVWFWGNGPIDLMMTLFGVRITSLFWERILSTFIVGFPTIVFAKSSLLNFLKVLNDPRALERDTDLAWERISQLDQERKSHGGQK